MDRGTKDNMIKALSLMTALVYVGTSLTKNVFLNYDLPLLNTIVNFILKGIIFLPVTIIGGMLSTAWNSLFVGDDLLKMTLGIGGSFVIYSIITYLYLQVITSIFRISFKKKEERSKKPIPPTVSRRVTSQGADSTPKK